MYPNVKELTVIIMATMKYKISQLISIYRANNFLTYSVFANINYG